uniref:60S ribosomal export protein NMD3 n=1 Tax=Steinernema glaseri TaxID=37863 RepID=A0A1I7ZEZ3_9BILA
MYALHAKVTDHVVNRRYDRKVLVNARCAKERYVKILFLELGTLKFVRLLCIKAERNHQHMFSDLQITILEEAVSTKALSAIITKGQEPMSAARRKLRRFLSDHG